MNLEKIYTEYLIKSISIETLIRKIIKIVATNDIDENIKIKLIPIVRLNLKTDEKFKAPEILNKIINKHYSNYSKNIEGYAQSILKDKCLDLLDQKITPYEFSKIISPLECLFDYPAWLGELYNVFDWCDENTEINNNIINELQERIKDLNRIINEHTTSHKRQLRD